jgi:hypothetical protein
MLKVYVKEMLTPEDIAMGVTNAPEEILFRELNSEALTGKDVIDCMAPIIDQPGWEILDKIDAESRKMETMSVRTERRTTRTEKMAFMSNGRNTVQLLDWEVKSNIVTHDPEIRMIGPDAADLAETFCAGMLERLMDRIVTINVDETVVKDIAGLKGVSVDSIKTTIEAMKQEIKSFIDSI